MTTMNSRGLTCSAHFVERCDLIRAHDGAAVSITGIYEKKCSEYMEHASRSSSSSRSSSLLPRSAKKSFSFSLSFSGRSCSSPTFTRSQRTERKDQEKRKDYKDIFKKFSRHVGQCAIKALAIPTVVLLDIVGNIVGWYEFQFVGKMYSTLTL